MIRIPESVEDAVVRILRIANTKLPSDIGWALEAAAGWESNPVAYTQLGAIMDNVKLAENTGRPMCQDTGIPVFYVSGSFDSSVAGRISEGLRRATAEIPLRPNTVDPLTRENHGDNLGAGMPVIRYNPTDDDFLQITVMPKGAGSENMTRLAMLNPSDGEEGIRDFVINTVLDAGGKPCPPTVVGVGIGGISETCIEMAKEAMAAPIDSDNPDKALAKMEEELFVKLNSSGLGPMGLGGDTTVLAVRVRKAQCHTASLPVAVAIGCWAMRRATVRIHTDGTTEYFQGERP